MQSAQGALEKELDKLSVRCAPLVTVTLSPLTYLPFFHSFIQSPQEALEKELDKLSVLTVDMLNPSIFIFCFILWLSRRAPKTPLRRSWTSCQCAAPLCLSLSHTTPLHLEPPYES